MKYAYLKESQTIIKFISPPHGEKRGIWTLDERVTRTNTFSINMKSNSALLVENSKDQKPFFESISN